MGVEFTTWTHQRVKSRIIEAAETIQALPRADRPKAFGSAWPDTISKYGNGMPYRYVPSPGAISRMQEVWNWINELDSELDRKFIYGYAAVKVQKGATISGFAEKNGIQTRGIQRQINKHCQTLADNLNKNSTFLETFTEPEVSQNSEDHATNRSTSGEERKKDIYSWMAPDAKPKLDPKIKEIAK